MSASIEGWMFGQGDEAPWNELREGLEMKTLAAADGTMISLFRFGAGFVGEAHPHAAPEFGYLLEGTMVMNGVEMKAGDAYAAGTGTSHDEFRTDTGATLLSVFNPPG